MPQRSPSRRPRPGCRSRWPRTVPPGCRPGIPPPAAASRRGAGPRPPPLSSFRTASQAPPWPCRSCPPCRSGHAGRGIRPTAPCSGRSPRPALRPPVSRPVPAPWPYPRPPSADTPPAPASRLPASSGRPGCRWSWSTGWRGSREQRPRAGCSSSGRRTGSGCQRPLPSPPVPGWPAAAGSAWRPGRPARPAESGWFSLQVRLFYCVRQRFVLYSV